MKIKTLKEKMFLIIGSGLGLGYSPIMPGTCGTLLGIPIFYLLKENNIGFIIFTLILFFIGISASNFISIKFKQKDPSFIVIDEIVGFLIAAMFIEFSILNIALIFVFFRLFDIIKPFPIKKLEKLSLGWGVMSDDVLAGIYANIIVRIILVFI
jgi:phosphatidylglycerophosphatase A